MNTMLAREGLGGKGYLDIKDFMKQYEQQQSAAEAAPGSLHPIQAPNKR